MNASEAIALIDQVANNEYDAAGVEKAVVDSIYIENRSSFRLLAKRMKLISKGTGGIISNGNQMFWASVLFARLTVTALSVLAMAPVPQPRQHWDFSALASLVRNLSECYFVLYFLCFDKISDDERNARFLMMHLYDNFSRRRMLLDLGLFDSHANAYEENRKDLEKRIRLTTFFSTLSETRQNAILKADRMPFIQDDILEKTGFDRQKFRGLYRLLSSHTHTGPIAFYRMHEYGSGTGIENIHDKAYMSFALSLAIQIVQGACENILLIFPQAEQRGSRILDKNLPKHIK